LACQSALHLHITRLNRLIADTRVRSFLLYKLRSTCLHSRYSQYALTKHVVAELTIFKHVGMGLVLRSNASPQNYQ